MDPSGMASGVQLVMNTEATNVTSQWLGQNWQTFQEAGHYGLRTWAVPIPSSDVEDVIQDTAIQFIHVDALRFFIHREGEELKSSLTLDRLGLFIARKAIKWLQRAGQDVVPRSSLGAQTKWEWQGKTTAPQPPTSYEVDASNSQWTAGCQMELVESVCTQIFPDNAERYVAIIKRRVEGYSQTEIAAEFGSTKGRIGRVLQRVRREFQPFREALCS